MSSTAISAQGSILQIGTGSGGAKTISAVVVGSPTIFTSAAHGLSNGDVVTLAGLTGTDAALFNGLSFTVQNKTTNTFSLAVDTTGKTVTAGSGTATPVTYTAIGNIKDYNGFDGQAGEIDVTNMSSVAKEFRLGLVDSGHFNMNYDLDNGDAGQLAIRAAQVSGALKNFKLTLPGGTTPNASFTAFVKSMPVSGAVDQVVKSSSQLRISGPVTWS